MTERKKDTWRVYLQKKADDQRAPLHEREQAARALIAMERPLIKLRFTFYRVP